MFFIFFVLVLYCIFCVVRYKMEESQSFKEISKEALPLERLPVGTYEFVENRLGFFSVTYWGAPGFDGRTYFVHPTKEWPRDGKGKPNRYFVKR